jgi:hypothetical protein
MLASNGPFEKKFLMNSLNALLSQSHRTQVEKNVRCTLCGKLIAA